MSSFSPSFFKVLTSKTFVNVELGVLEDGFKLYLERHCDDSGVAIPIDEETFKALEKNFILKEIEEH